MRPSSIEIRLPARSPITSETVATLRVPLSVEIGTGHSWAEAH